MPLLSFIVGLLIEGSVIVESTEEGLNNVIIENRGGFEVRNTGETERVDKGVKVRDVARMETAKDFLNWNNEAAIFTDSSFDKHIVDVNPSEDVDTSYDREESPLS